MVDEPIYDFVPGQGWVVSGERKILGKTYDGFPIWIIDRKPKIGELFRAAAKMELWISRLS